MKRMKQLFTCKTCTVQTAEEMEKKFFPRFCIGHVAFVVMGVILVIVELTN
ncbi:hypothetical protein SAMN04244570_2797 [Sporosarcina newyorkensis]|uniref:Uncharacterized protein n=1 Tax=Sporosarcina newyorkensis TaxID=759851 RepID=A0A1T4YJI5_9BACL|nr:hypothetical protein SAMN04244570_2797 [Sporosarcina newyorkensis]